MTKVEGFDPSRFATGQYETDEDATFRLLAVMQHGKSVADGILNRLVVVSYVGQNDTGANYKLGSVHSSFKEGRLSSGEVIAGHLSRAWQGEGLCFDLYDGMYVSFADRFAFPLGEIRDLSTARAKAVPQSPDTNPGAHLSVLA